jgi:hypothetical protein
MVRLAHTSSNREGGIGRVALLGILRGGAALDYLHDVPRVYVGPNRAGPRGPTGSRPGRTPGDVAAILADWRAGLGFRRLRQKWGGDVQRLIERHTTAEERRDRNRACGVRCPK